MAAETLGSLTKGQEKLLEQQTHLKTTQELASQHISSTMRELSRERVAAFASQKQLAIISKTLKETLDHTTKMAMQQEDERRMAQHNLLQSLTSIEGQVSDFWGQLGKIFSHNSERQQFIKLLMKSNILNSQICIYFFTCFLF